MDREHRPHRAGLSRIEVLLATTLGATFAGLLVIAVAGCSRPSTGTPPAEDPGKAGATSNPADKVTQIVNKSRVECSDNLRDIGIAMISFDVVNLGFPSDKNTNYKDQSFYTQLLDSLELGALAPSGTPNPKGVAKYYVCPGRRKAKDVPGACDYGYVASSGVTSLSVLDSTGTGVMGTTISNGAGTQNTIVLSHYWLAPANYGSAGSPSAQWAKIGSGYAVAYDKGTRGYEDSDTAGTGSMGSPHSGRMPCLFADGSIGLLPYDHPQFRLMWNFANTTTALNNVPDPWQEKYKAPKLKP